MLKQQAAHMKSSLQAAQQRFEQDRARLEKDEIDREQRNQQVQRLRDEDAAKQAQRTLEMQRLRNRAFKAGFQRLVETEGRRQQAVVNGRAAEQKRVETEGHDSARRRAIEQVRGQPAQKLPLVVVPLVDSRSISR